MKIRLWYWSAAKQVWTLADKRDYVFVPSEWRRMMRAGGLCTAIERIK